MDRLNVKLYSALSTEHYQDACMLCKKTGNYTVRQIAQNLRRFKKECDVIKIRNKNYFKLCLGASSIDR